MVTVFCTKWCSAGLLHLCAWSEYRGCSGSPSHANTHSTLLFSFCEILLGRGLFPHPQNCLRIDPFFDQCIVIKSVFFHISEQYAAFLPSSKNIIKHGSTSVLMLCIFHFSDCLFQLVKSHSLSKEAQKNQTGANIAISLSRWQVTGLPPRAGKEDCVELEQDPGHPLPSLECSLYCNVIFIYF